MSSVRAKSVSTANIKKLRRWKENLYAELNRLEIDADDRFETYGTYGTEIPNAVVKFTDRRKGRKYRVHFVDGQIILEKADG